MIVKKMPILQGFPDPDTVKFLSSTELKLSEFTPVFYDIETTGLSRYSTFVYLIGAIRWEDDQWILTQWFGESPEEEALIIREFTNYLQGSTYTIQYNGNRFDQPYLEERCRKNELPSPFEGLASIDVYQALKSCQSLFKLSRMKQPDLENLFPSMHRTYCDGGQCIRLYRSYIKKKDPKALETVLGHNQEDLHGLGLVFTLLSYRSLYLGKYEPSAIRIHDQQELVITLKLEHPVPISVSCVTDEFYFTADREEARLLLHLKNGKLRQYYSNYKDYEYLPGEDQAIPKSLSRYMDKSLRIPATPQTCYTWFCCDESFLTDRKKQMHYLGHSLPCLLNNLGTRHAGPS